MRAIANLSVKGTSYYKAAELLQKGSLSSGLAICLEHEPGNPYDKNAVAVRVKDSTAILGHITRDLASTYAILLKSGKIIDAIITRVAKNGAYINIDIMVSYEQCDNKFAVNHSSYRREADARSVIEHSSHRPETEARSVIEHSSPIRDSTSSLPMVPGVYSIRNTDSGKQYIGSSKNMKNRLRQHIRELSIGHHANNALQVDFSKLGENYFEVIVLAIGMSPSNLLALEADRISSFRNAGSALYNLTANGQGIGRNGFGSSNSETISDKLAGGRAEAERSRIKAERRRIEEIFAGQRKNILDAFEPRLAALLPQIGPWAHFIALLASPLTRRYFQEMTEKTMEYENLIKQRDGQLAAVDEERNKLQRI